MIDSIKLVPEIYAKESRDFQFFARLYNIAFNYIESNIKLIGTIKDSKVLELLVRTLGFEPKRKYSTVELYTICQSFINIIRNKGSLKGIELAVKTALRTKGKNKYAIVLDTIGADKKQILVIYVDDSVGSSEITLLEELLDYVAPINSLYTIKQASKQDTSIQEIQVKTAYNVSNIRQKFVSGIAIDSSNTLKSKSETVSEKGNLQPDSTEPLTGDIRFEHVLSQIKNEDNKGE